jgi:RimJ/RimL family protein N-acetyltransferase
MNTVITTSCGAITIRPVTADDGDALRDLRLEALRTQPVAFAADYATNAAKPPGYWIEWARDRSNSHADVVHVAVAGDRLIGMTGAHRGDSPKTRHSALIWGVYVRPEWRGLKIADRLIEACLDWAQAHGVRITKLNVVTTNTAAIRCYLRCGFRVYGVEPQAVCYDGVCYDDLLMARPIGE